jgi:hypothetical protein
VQVVLLDDFVWEQGEWQAHVFKAGKGSVQVKILDVYGH